MRTIFRWLFRLLILAIVLAVALVLLKDTIAKALAEKVVRQQTGLSVDIAKLEIGLFAPTFKMEGFKLYNAPDFGGAVLLDIPEVQFEYDGWALRSRKAHLRVLRFHLAELNLIRNQAGQTNLFSLPGPMGTPSKAPGGDRGSSLDFAGIDRLYLSLGTIRYTDQARPSKSWQRTLNWKNQEVTTLKTAKDVQNWFFLILVQIALSPDTLPQGGGLRTTAPVR